MKPLGPLVVFALLIGSATAAPAALTTQACLAKKLEAWGKLRACAATTNAKAAADEIAAAIRGFMGAAKRD